MSESAAWTAESIAEPVRTAFEAADLEAIGALLSPDVTWGAPEQKRPSCQNRQQVLTWFANGPNANSTAKVAELTVAGDQLLVGLLVTPETQESGNVPSFERWQILTIDSRGVSDIRGYEDRHEAAEALGTYR